MYRLIDIKGEDSLQLRVDRIYVVCTARLIRHLLDGTGMYREGRAWNFGGPDCRL
jgi:hypothetical protein